MEQVCIDLLHDHSYESLLNYTDEVLSGSPEDSTALVFKGRALACLHRYLEAAEILSLAIKNLGKSPQREKIQVLERNCRKISCFEQEYARNTKDFLAFSDDWYSERLSNIMIKTADSQDEDECEESTPPRLPITLGPVYILGPAERIDTFQGVENDFPMKLQTKPHSYPLMQADDAGYLYQKDQTFTLPYGRDHEQFTEDEHVYPEPVAEFPTADWEVNQENVQQPHPECDVFIGPGLVDEMVSNMLQCSLDKLAAQTQDLFVPMYQNIIDPNLTAVKTEEKYKWTATDFIMEEKDLPKIDITCALQGCIRRIIGRGLPWHSVELIFLYLDSKDKRYFRSLGRAHLAAPISNLNPMENKELYVAVEAVLTAAAPLLAKLRKPALLLPGKLQAVVKAQRIYLQPGEEYTGVWHTDGLNEDIVAVVLYYYRYSDELVGGDLEFMSRRPRKENFWLLGDWDPSTLSKPDVENFLTELPHCKVPVKKGTLVVFSNYQLVHRVLRMASPSTATGDASAPGGLASRDFLVLFIVDQRSPLTSTCDLFPLQILENSESVRKSCFYKQLEPTGKFGVSDELIYSGGNGSVALLGWMETQIADADTEFFTPEDLHGLGNIHKLSVPPPLGRGVSWILDADSWIKEN